MILKYAVAYIASIAVFLLLDFLWLGVFARDFYRTRMGKAVQMQVKWSVAFLFYFLHVVGLFYFVIAAGAADAGVASVLIRGAVYGFFTYATYDLTNLATVRGWPAGLAVVDILWGSFLNAVVAMVGFLVQCRF